MLKIWRKLAAPKVDYYFYHFPWLLGTIFFVCIVDQGLKLLFLNFFPELAYINSGWGFGLFPDYNFYWALFAFIFFAVAFTYQVYRWRERRLGWLGLFLGAILSNLIDRVRHGGVIDIQINSYLPAVNIADLILTTVFFLLVCGRIGLLYEGKD